jgi:hypothetical protein
MNSFSIAPDQERDMQIEACKELAGYLKAARDHREASFVRDPKSIYCGGYALTIEAAVEQAVPESIRPVISALMVAGYADTVAWMEATLAR